MDKANRVDKVDQVDKVGKADRAGKNIPVRSPDSLHPHSDPPIFSESLWSHEGIPVARKYFAVMHATRTR